MVAQRAGYRCSVPDCRRLTIGPGRGADEVVDIGVAGHIYSASPGGPRGTGGLSFEDRRSAENAIWLCADHGRLVDANDGGQYPDSLLRSWKGLHESFTAMELGGHPRPFGWIESLTFTDASAKLAGRQFFFGPRNIIVGHNGSGKTILTKTIAGIGKPHYLAHHSRDRLLTGSVRWHDPLPHELSFRARDGRVQHELDGRSVPYVAKPYRTVLLNDPGSLWRARGVSDLARLLEIDVTMMTNILGELPKYPGSAVSAVSIKKDNVRVRMKYDPDEWRSFGHLFTAVRVRLVLEAATMLAEIQSEVEPTLLVFDGFLENLDTPHLGAMHSFLADARPFQVVVATICPPPSSVRPRWLITAFPPDERELAFLRETTPRITPETPGLLPRQRQNGLPTGRGRPVSSPSRSCREPGAAGADQDRAGSRA